MSSNHVKYPSRPLGSRGWTVRESPPVYLDSYSDLYEHEGDTPSIDYRHRMRLNVVLDADSGNKDLPLDLIRFHCNVLARMLYSTNSEKTPFVWQLGKRFRYTARITSPMESADYSRCLALDDDSMFLKTDLCVTTKIDDFLNSTPIIQLLDGMVGKSLEEIYDNSASVTLVHSGKLVDAQQNEVTVITDKDDKVLFAMKGKVEWN